MIDIQLELGSGQGITIDLGTPGPAGPPGPAGADTTLVASVALSGHRTISVDAAGEAVYASCLDSTAQRVAGLSGHAAAQGNPLVIHSLGPLDWPAANLTPDAPLFLGEDGALTEVAPTYGWCRQIATAVAVDRIVISIGPAYWRGPLNP